MYEKVEHNCAVVVAHTLHDAYSFGKSLQHRGREAVGLAAVNHERIDVVKWEGTIDRFSIKDLHKIFPGHNYHSFMLHVRYATRGRKNQILNDAHPHTIGGTRYDLGNHLFVLDCDLAIIHNGQIDNEFFEGIDKSRLRTGCDSEAALHYFKEHGENEMLRKIPGAYTLAIADKTRKDIIILRDRTGIKPGALGWKDGKYVISSEDIAFLENGALFKEDLNPGCVYYLNPEGNYRKEKVVDSILQQCFFEWNYVANVLSILSGISVRTVRSLLGESLAEEHNLPEIDVVTFMPRCPEPAAEKYAEKIGKPFEYVFYKTRDERAFQGSTLEERTKSIEGNLFLMPGIEEKIRGKVVAVIDDSIIRGNNSRRSRKLLYKSAEVKEAILLSYTPQVGIIGNDGIERGCMFGVDMPPDDRFIARNRTLEEISGEMDMPVKYLSKNRMLKVFETLGLSRKNLCYFCIGGEHPFRKNPFENQ